MDETTQTSTPGNKGGMNMVIVVIAIAVVLIGGYMLLNKPETTVAPTTDSVPTTQDSTQPTDSTGMDHESMAGDVMTIDMEAGAFYFTPKEIRVKKGQTVRINFAAKDMMHDFNIDELNVKSPIVQAGESTVIEFVASESGSFEYYCSVGQHRANGQVGTLIVEE